MSRPAVWCVLSLALAASCGEEKKGEEGKAAGAPAKAETPATAPAASDETCGPELKKTLGRVLTACGLIAGEDAHGEQPARARSVAPITGADFAALFRPVKDRGGVIEFDQGKADLGPEDIQLIDAIFTEQRAARTFLVVSRVPLEGSIEGNRTIARQRAESVMDHLRQQFQDPDLDKEVGLLSLDAERTHLDPELCTWRRSGDPDRCKNEHIDRSAVVAWIDCAP